MGALRTVIALHIFTQRSFGAAKDSRVQTQ
jgi:hypothetical protein